MEDNHKDYRNKMELLKNIDKIHTTELGKKRIKINLDLTQEDVLSTIKELLLKKDCRIFQKGKNYYCEIQNIQITINKNNYCVITAHKMKKKQAIIFDLDGTLWDVTKQTVLAYNEILKKHNYPSIPETKIRKNFGNNKTDTLKFLFANFSSDEGKSILEEIALRTIKNINENCDCIYEGVEDTLKKLYKQYELFIVSNNSQKSYIESFLQAGNLTKYFKDYIAASSIPLSKAEAILKIMKDYQIEDAIYIGDTKKDMEAAKKANISFIQCLYGFGEELNCKMKINHIKELPNCIERRNAYEQDSARS